MINTERAGRWLRVSTGRQDEASQAPDIDAWCDSHGYEVAKTYLLHGRSAYKGRQDAAIEEVLADMRAGRITVLVVWASDRIERRGAARAFDLAQRVRQAGGRIEYVRDAYLNDANEMSDVMLALAATRDREESRRKSERILAKHAALRAAGSLVGRPPYGYRIVARDGIKVLEPEPAEAAVIRDAAQSYLNGHTLQAISDHLNAAGRTPRPSPTAWRTGNGPRWYPKTLSQVLRNEVLAGRRKDASGQTVLKVPPILSRKTWEAVTARLDARASRKGISQAPHPALLTSILICGKCRRPMYKSGTGYFCHSTEPDPQRPGRRRPTCHNFIRLERADQAVSNMMAASRARDVIETVVPGRDHADEIREVKRDLAEAVEAEDFGRLDALRRELDRLRALPAEPPRTERRYSPQTVGQMWAAMQTDYERREYLLSRGVAVSYEDGWLVAVAPPPAGTEPEAGPGELAAAA